MLATLLAAVSSCGSLTSDGVNAICAERNGLPTRGAMVASTNTSATGPSNSTSAAAASTSTVRIRSQATITDLRGRRSASTAPKGDVTAIMVSRTVPQTPTAAAPPTS